MLEISNIIGERKEEINSQKSKNIGERHIILGDIHERLKTSSFKKISTPFLATLLSPYKTSELYDIHSRCNNGNNYAALFWYFVSPKKE